MTQEISNTRHNLDPAALALVTGGAPPDGTFSDGTKIEALQVNRASTVFQIRDTKNKTLCYGIANNEYGSGGGAAITCVPLITSTNPPKAD